MIDFTRRDFDKEYNHLIALSKFNIRSKGYEDVLGVLLQIQCGLSKGEIEALYWKDIYELDSSKNPTIRKELKIRNYRIFIPNGLREVLSEYHSSLNFVVSDHLPFFIKAPEFDLRPIFAKRLFEVNGYSDECIKDLKVQFKIRHTSELLKFCRLSKKAEIQYNLFHIDLDQKKALVTLHDKNFNNGKEYSFQSFSSFSNFLKKDYPNVMFREGSIRLLLWLSLYSGIRLTEFLKLDWNDFLYCEFDKKRIYVHNVFQVSGLRFRLPSDLRTALLLHFESYIVGKHYEEFIENYSKDKKLRPNQFLDDWEGFGNRVNNDYDDNSYFEVKEFPNLLLKDKLFQKDNFKPIIPNNLAREIRAALFHLGHGNPDELKANSTLIMWARRIIEIKGDHKPTIRVLKKHFYFRTKLELAHFLSLVDGKGKIEFEGVCHPNKFEEMSFDF